MGLLLCFCPEPLPPEESHHRGPGCGQETHFWLQETPSDREHQPGESGCPIWNHQSNPIKLVPRKKALGLKSKPTGPAQKETSASEAFPLWLSVSSGLEGGYV